MTSCSNRTAETEQVMTGSILRFYGEAVQKEEQHSFGFELP